MLEVKCDRFFINLLIKKRYTIWLLSEIILNLLGLDNLADYSEYLFDQEVKIATSKPQMTLVVPFRRPLFKPNLAFRYTIAQRI